MQESNGFSVAVNHESREELVGFEGKGGMTKSFVGFVVPSVPLRKGVG
jgi:hypothetical protein